MASDTVTLVTALIGVVCGVTGTVLGVINTVTQLLRNKVRLKVVPSHAIPVGGLRDARLNFQITVVNLSDFAVVLEDVGFRLRGGRHAIFGPLQGLEPSGTLPLRLEPRSSYSKVVYLEDDSLDWSAVQCAYARTQCGTEATGTSGALRQLIREWGTHHD